MNFKKRFSVIASVALSFFIISCGNNSSPKNMGQQSNLQDSVQPTNADTSALQSPLPSGVIALDKLPKGIKEFTEKVYPGYKIINAASDPLCSGGDAIDVAVTKTGSPNLSLIFKPDGSFVQQEQDVPLSTAPPKIKDVLKAKYPGYSAGNQIEKLILADKTVQFLVDLNKGAVSKEVIFDTNGTVVCEN